MLRYWLPTLAAITIVQPSGVASEETPPEPSPVRIYIDADRSVMTGAGDAIEWGVRTALRESDDRLLGRPVQLVILDHRGNNGRVARHLDRFSRDSLALAMVSGMHSPPLLQHQGLINEKEILILNPWAAAGPITRPPAPPNWVFRLSIDDTKAGEVIVRRAYSEGFRRPHLVLERTGWGESNERTMLAALDKLGVVPTGVSWFNWGLTPLGARILLRAVVEGGADVIFLVANGPEGATLCKAMLELGEPLRLPVRSHWGITGGDFASQVGFDRLQRLDLLFLQTRFPTAGDGNPSYTRVEEVARQVTPLASLSELKAPTGFFHAYDLTRILVSAVEQAGFAPTVPETRRRVHRALEALEGRLPGLMRNYHRPFAPYSTIGSDAHEALGIEDYTLGRYTNEGRIRLVTEDDSNG